jgi:glutathione S-transferase
LGWARRFGKHPDALADAREAFALRLAFVSRMLSDGRQYLAAGRFTLADISVGYALGLSALSGLDDLIPPDVAVYHDLLKARPAYQRAYAVD